MKIGYFIPEFPGQTHIFFWRELRALEAAGMQCDVVSTRKPEKSRISHTWAQEGMQRTTYLMPAGAGLVAAGMQAIRSGPRGWLRCLHAIRRAEGLSAKGKARLAGLALMGARLAGLARQNGWKHIHVHSCADSAHIAMFAHLLSGITYSLTLHGPLVDYGPNQKQKWQHALFAIVITRRLLQEVRSELGSAAPELIEVAPMGVEVESFIRTRPYQPWNGSGPCLIFTCGRLNPCKGHDDLIRAVALLREKGIDARLHVAGADDQGGVYRTHLEAVARESNLNGHLKLLGAVSEDVVRGELESSHVFSLASLREPLGVAIMEAMAMRVPVVVTGAGGVPELISDGEDGVLVDPQQPAQLAAALERVLKNPRFAERLGESGRQKVEQGFHSGLSADVLRRCLGKTVGTGT